MFALLAAEGPNYRFLPADMREFWWAASAFLVIFLLLVWKLLPTIKAAMSARSDRIREEIVDAERAKVEAESELSMLRSKLGDSDAEAARIREDAEKTAETVKADLIARADAEATDITAKANVEMSASAGQATADIQSAVAAQAATVAESVVHANLDDATHASLIDSYIEQVGQS